VRPLQVAIVTGGDSGIGRSVALLMAKEGAKAVAIVHLPKEQAVSWFLSFFLSSLELGGVEREGACLNWQRGAGGGHRAPAQARAGGELGLLPSLGPSAEGGGQQDQQQVGSHTT
jgi:NAD(P)-dependent dehydrogenase (short-subunit alcohol dehydrogenase family)